MEQMNFRRGLFLPIIFLVFASLFIGCQNETIVDPGNGEPTTDQGALEKLVDEDSSLTSFDANYNEEELIEYLGKTNEQIYPFRVWHRMRLVNRNLNIEFVGDTAYGVLTKTFEGVLFIKASYDSVALEPDTLIQKPFTAVITRNIIFIKTDHTPHPHRNWRIAAISLPEGGTQSPNIDIMKLTIILPVGEPLVIESPNDYYLKRWHGWWRQIPIIPRGGTVHLKVELYSLYEEEDFVSVTYGANRFCHHRAKKLFDLVSSTPNGDGFDKVYEQSFTAHQIPGFYHAVINAMPRQVIFDDSTPVEAEAWGVPYFVHWDGN